MVQRLGIFLQCKGSWFDPRSRKIPHATGRYRATKPVCHNRWSLFTWARAPQEKPPQWEACACQLESSPHLLQLEKAPAQQQRPSVPKSRYINK